MLKKSLVIAVAAAGLGAAALSTPASAGDPLAGALIGGGIGAAIGHSTGSHNGAAVGGVLGAIVGSSIAADSGPYYGSRYYGYRPPVGRYYVPPPAPVYYGPAPLYYEPAPVYYGPSIVFESGPRYRGHPHRDWRRHEWRERHEWRGHHRH
jgi:hypothetical protein